MKLILGSESPFRKRLMELAGYTFDVVPADIDEKAIRFDDPSKLVEALGLAKMNAVMDKINLDTDIDDVIIITSDQVVIRLHDEQILEKPLDLDGKPDKTAAALMLMSYASSPVQTMTSLVVRRPRHYPMPIVRVDRCTIDLKDFTDEEIQQMVEDPRTFQACGALPYGIEDSPASQIVGEHVVAMRGEESSFIGLPMDLLEHALHDLGYLKY